MKNNILIIAATHGNEPIGVEVIKELEKRGLGGYFDMLIANPHALAAGKEFVDVNLNRVYPGRKDSRLHEERLAYSNLQSARKYRYVIDLHEASQGKDDFIIVPRENISDKFPLELIDLKRVLLWPDPKGPLAQVLENAIELEFGSFARDRREMVAKAAGIIGRFISSLEAGRVGELCQQEKYYVYGKISAEEFTGNINELVDFEEYEYNDEVFLPLLARQYLASGIVCYKMRRVG